MKLDSTIIGALIIGASILLSTMYYAKNTDYQTCVRHQTKLYMGNASNTRSDLGKRSQAFERCGIYLREK